MSLKASAVSGAKWTTFSTCITTIFQLAQLAVLAHLLSPEDFGLMAMLMVVIGFAQSYADMGVSNAIIHRQDVTPDQLSSLYWLNLFAGSIVFVVLFLATPLVSAFYQESRLTGPMHWAILVLLIAPVGQQFQILLQKELRFKTLAHCEILSRFVGFLVAVVAAWRGAGVYALIWSALASAGVLSLSLLVMGWPLHCPRLRFRFTDTKGFLGFGAYQMGERSINYFNGNLDKLIIGRLLGAEALGYYNLAWNLVIQPVERINPIFTRVAFPVFARLQSQPEALKRGFLQIMRVLSTANSAALFGIAAVAPLLVPVVFGQRWLPAVVLVQILAFVSLLRSVGNPIGSLLLARGRADLGFKWNLALLFSQWIGIVVGARFGGLEGVGLGLLVLQVAYFLPGYRFLVSPLLGRCWKEYLGSMLPGFWVSASMGFIVWGFLLALARTAIDPKLLLVAGIAVGVIYFVVITLTARRKELFEMLRLAGLSR